MSGRPKRERKPSSKIAFLESHSDSWEEHKKDLDDTKGERKRKRLQQKKLRASADAAKRKRRKKGTKKGGRKKNSKGGPKKPLSAYMFFCRETRDEVIEEFPSATFGEVAQILGEWWQDCTASEKSKFNRLSQQDKRRYEAECNGEPVPPMPKSTKRTTKAKRSTKRASRSGKPSYFDMAKDAIMSLKNRRGSSQVAIEKFILEKYLDEDKYKRHHLRKALNTATDNGKFLKIKASFKVSPAEKKRK